MSFWCVVSLDDDDTDESKKKDPTDPPMNKKRKLLKMKKKRALEESEKKVGERSPKRQKSMYDKMYELRIFSCFVVAFVRIVTEKNTQKK